jgi:hypothetical protein
MERLIYIPQEELTAFNKAQQEITKRVHAMNPPRPRPRSSDEIKLDIQRLVGEARTNVNGDEGLLPRWTRLLAEKLKYRDETREAVKRTERTIAELKAAGIEDRDSRMRQLCGWTSRSKVTDAPVYHPGVLDDLKQELELLEVRIRSLRTAVDQSQARVDRELPALEAELKAARKAESLL